VYSVILPFIVQLMKFMFGAIGSSKRKNWNYVNYSLLWTIFQ